MHNQKRRFEKPKPRSSALHKLKIRIIHNVHRLERARVLCEVGATGFVAYETHLTIFVPVLVLWALLDLVYLMGVKTK